MRNTSLKSIKTNKKPRCLGHTPEYSELQKINLRWKKFLKREKKFLRTSLLKEKQRTVVPNRRWDKGSYPLRHRRFCFVRLLCCYSLKLLTDFLCFVFFCNKTEIHCNKTLSTAMPFLKVVQLLQTHGSLWYPHRSSSVAERGWRVGLALLPSKDEFWECSSCHNSSKISSVEILKTSQALITS